MMNEEGYVYCISNEFMPGIYKVGVTMRSPLERLKEANSSDTWKIPTYKIEFAKKVMDPKDKEKKLHKLLEKLMTRVHTRREFFRGEVNDVREIFDLLDGEIWYEDPNPNQDHNPNSLSRDPETLIKQLIGITEQTFPNHSVDFKQRSGGKWFNITVDDKHILVLENYTNDRSKIGLFTTPCRSEIDNSLIRYYHELNWEPFGNRSSRKQYDTENKTKEDIVQMLEGFKTVLTSSQESTMDIKKIIWSDQRNLSLTDKFQNTYSFSSENWMNNKYINYIHKNGELFRCKQASGIHRGYCIWIDSNDIIHFSHGHQNPQKISHCIFDDNTLTDEWLCNWGKFTKKDIDFIHNHFGISSV
tara:strand:+ start:2168 stop:3241 length:1074 start_codon:yes stop_codon:yes gene_type:complete